MVADNASPEQEKKIRIRLNPQALDMVRPKQIVNSSESKNKKQHKDAKFLGEHTQTVDRQTTSSSVGSFKEAGQGVRNGVEKAKPQQVAKQVKPQKKVLKKSKEKIDFSDLNFALNKTKPVFRAPAALGLKNGNNKTTGLSKNNDFIEDIPLGDMTALNTVETKYYGFYHRIRQRLEQYWGNSLDQKITAMFKKGRKIASETNHITSLQIILDPQGNIIDILIKSTSGIRELDDAAIESFSKAGPFPNPPTGMIKNGMATLEWGFVVKG